jgi:hypothetical protein
MKRLESVKEKKLTRLKEDDEKEKEGEVRETTRK